MKGPVFYWSQLDRTGKASFIFRLLAYLSAIVLIVVHHYENSLNLSWIDIISIFAYLILPYLFMLRASHSENGKRSVRNQINYDFISTGWFVALVNISLVPSIVFTIATLLNKIAAHGFRRLYFVILLFLGYAIPFMLGEKSVLIESSQNIIVLSGLYGFVHLVILAYISYEYARELRSRSYQVKRQQEEISIQSEELKSLNESLIDLNHNLETTVADRTRELKLKNKQLAEYAFINAHKLRAPIATLQGLLHLIDKDKKNQFEIIDRIKDSIEVLVLIVTDIRITLEREHNLSNPSNSSTSSSARSK